MMKVMRRREHRDNVVLLAVHQEVGSLLKEPLNQIVCLNIVDANHLQLELIVGVCAMSFSNYEITSVLLNR